MKKRGRKTHSAGGGKQMQGRCLLLLARANKRALTMCGGCCMLPVFRRYKTKNGAKTQINGYASFLFVFQLSNNW